MDGLTKAWDASATGVVVGAEETHQTKRWSSAISRGGESVAVVVGGNLPDTLWWQVFQPSDGMWRPVGIRCETPVTWIQMNPVAVSDDGSTMWGLRSDDPGGGGGTRQYPISVDTATGKWTYWFQPQDLKVPADDFDVIALILRWSGEIRLADGVYR